MELNKYNNIYCDLSIGVYPITLVDIPSNKKRSRKGTATMGKIGWYIRDLVWNRRRENIAWFAMYLNHKGRIIAQPVGDASWIWIIIGKIVKYLVLGSIHVLDFIIENLLYSCWYIHAWQLSWISWHLYFRLGRLLISSNPQKL